MPQTTSATAAAAAIRTLSEAAVSAERSKNRATITGITTTGRLRRCPVNTGAKVAVDPTTKMAASTGATAAVAVIRCGGRGRSRSGTTAGIRIITHRMSVFRTTAGRGPTGGSGCQRRLSAIAVVPAVAAAFLHCAADRDAVNTAGIRTAAGIRILIEATTAGAATA